MRRGITVVLILLTLAFPVNAAQWSAPEVPDSGSEWMPEEPVTFTDGVLEILSNIMPRILPSLTEAFRTCAAMIGVSLLVSVVQNLHGSVGKAADLSGSVTIGLILFGATNSMIHLGAETVTEISDYGKLLLPAMTASMAAGGGTTASAALYLGTAFFDSLLTTAISALMLPMVYVFLALAAANAALGEDILKQMKDFVKWLMTWTLRTVLYVFTGYV